MCTRRCICKLSLLPNKRLGTAPEAQRPQPSHCFSLGQRAHHHGRKKKPWHFSAGVSSRKSRGDHRVSGLEGSVKASWSPILRCMNAPMRRTGASLLILNYPNWRGNPQGILTRDDKTRDDPENCPRKSPRLSLSPWEAPPENWFWWNCLLLDLQGRKTS